MPDLTRESVRRLRALAAKVILDHKGRYDDKAYRAWLRESYGVASTLDLSSTQAADAIQALRARLRPRSEAPPQEHPSGRPHYTRRYHGAGQRGVVAHLTGAQAAEIARLEDALGWTPDPARLVGFIARTLRLQAPLTKTPSILTKAEATDLITALRRIERARAALAATTTPTT